MVTVYRRSGSDLWGSAKVAFHGSEEDYYFPALAIFNGLVKET